MSSANRPTALIDSLSYPNVFTWNDTAMLGDNDGGTTLIYIGKARPGASAAAAVWQIRKMSYDANGNVLSVTWPQNTSGNASNDFIFVWNSRASYTYS